METTENILKTDQKAPRRLYVLHKLTILHAIVME